LVIFVLLVVVIVYAERITRTALRVVAINSSLTSQTTI
jgi:hypothetical protein